ncbi:hypothetical protein JCM8547_002275 [Rhodosporidiobolus lusitaniae]
MATHNKEQLEKQIDDAFALRLEGNEKFKAGDLAGALMAYHNVLISLKGLDSAISSAYGPAPAAPVIPTGEEPEKKADEPPTKAEQVKTAILNTYLNMAAIHIKREAWKRALECAQQAKKLDEKNPKAAFREAQAKIGLGEITAGRKALEELNKTSPDSAITAALAKLAIDEKKPSKTTQQFRGMFNTKKPASSPQPENHNSNSNSTSVASTVKPGISREASDSAPKITELND